MSWVQKMSRMKTIRDEWGEWKLSYEKSLFSYIGRRFFSWKKVWSTMGKILSWFSLYHLTPTHSADLGPFSITNISTTYCEGEREKEKGECYKSEFFFCFFFFFSLSLSSTNQPTDYLNGWMSIISRHFIWWNWNDIERNLIFLAI